jgi:hypothetical protein
MKSLLFCGKTLGFICIIESSGNLGSHLELMARIQKRQKENMTFPEFDLSWGSLI